MFAERGKDAVSVNDITDAAGVGFGSFYNHFDSKDAFHEALVDAFVDDIEVRLGRRLALSADCAEIIAITVRYAVERAGTDSLWRRFLLRETFSARLRERGIQGRLVGSIQRGLAAGRFRLLEPGVGSVATAGGLIGVLANSLPPQDERAPGRVASEVRRLGVSTAATMLSALGLEPEEARMIATRPRRAASSPARSGQARSRSDRSLVFGLAGGPSSESLGATSVSSTSPSSGRPDG